VFRIKICGITRSEDALAAAEAGADAIGLNFFSGSKRCITPQTACQIAAAVRGRLAVAGVFVNASAEEIHERAAKTPLHYIQIHGNEPPELLAKLKGLPLIRAFSVAAQGTAAMQISGGGFKTDPREGEPPAEPKRPGATGNSSASAGKTDDSTHPASTGGQATSGTYRFVTRSIASVQGYLARCRELDVGLAAVMLDGFQPGHFGGTGRQAPWEVIAENRESLLGQPLCLAGGLNPENVAAAIEKVRPDAVDTASGVETSPGVKDAEQIERFVSAARAAWQANPIPPD